MEELRTVAQVRNYLRRKTGKTVGLVPTMGYFHEGHASLVRASVEENDVAIVSIFVNPAQFAPSEDLERYPRSEERDKRLCEDLGCGAVFLPDAKEVYGDEFGTWVECDVGKADRNERSEGAFRPTFFRGVATLVTKMMCLIRPDRVYFGQKDAQQVAVARRLVEDLWLGSCVRVCETVRESNGLAMSSRNSYLTEEQKEMAGAICRGMHAGKRFRESDEQVEASELREIVKKEVEREWTGLKDAEVMYVSVCDQMTFREVSGMVKRKVLLCVAAKLGGARLIDNIVI